MGVFKVVKETKKKSTVNIKDDTNKKNNEAEEDENDFIIKNNQKIKIGNKLFDEQTLTRCSIVKLSLLGYKIKQISKILKIKSSLAWKWSHFDNFYGKGFRKSKFTENEKEFLCKQAEGKIAGLGGASSRDLQKVFKEKFHKSISHTSVNTILNNGLSTPLRVVNTFILTNEHEEKRRKFADYILENNLSSEKILFTDECRVVLFPKLNKANNIVRYNKEERMSRYKPEIQKKRTNEVPKFEQSIMIAGGICHYGLTNLVFCSGTQNNFSYKQFLLFMKKDLDKFKEDNELKNDILFQQDNAACHTSYDSKAAIKVLFDKNSINWPPNSPDLSPIENVWAILKEKLSKRKIRNLDDLRENILDIWIKFPTSLCKKLCMQFDEKIKLIREFKGARINKEMMINVEKKNKKEKKDEGKDLNLENEWISVKREKKYRVVFNDKIVKTIKNRFIKQIKKLKITKIKEFKKDNSKLEKYEKPPIKGVSKKEYSKVLDEKKETIENYYDKLIGKVENASNEEFIIDYLDKEKDSNLKNLISSNLSKTFMLDEANTCISSKLEEIIDNENLENEKNIDNDMKILNLKLDEKLERNKLNTVKDYIINKNMNIKNLFPYEQKKLRRSDDNEINKINIIEKERNIYNILGEIKVLNEKIKKYNDINNIKEKDSEIQIEMASDIEEENMEIDD